MAFINQKSILINDRSGNLHNFQWDQDKIILKHFDQFSKNYKISTLADDVSLEFDAAIDDRDNIYIVFQKKDGSIVLMSRTNGVWNTSLLGKEKLQDIFNLNIILINQEIHIIYCVSLKENNTIYRIYHHYYEGSTWQTLQIEDIRRKNLLNPFQIIKSNEKLIIGFYDFKDYEEQIFIKEFDVLNKDWKNAVKLTSSFTDKLFIDILMYKPNALHLTYSEYFQENLVIKYEKYKLMENKAVKIMEITLSNPSNCSYPSFVLYNEKLWNVWTEYDQIVSCYSEDEGLTWSNPYLWKVSKGIDFFRHKFQTNDENIKANYQLNYAFGKGYPEYSLIGFGSLDNAAEIPLKYKKKNIDKESIQTDHEEFQIKNTIAENKGKGKEEISKLLEEIRKLEERIENIEEYIQRRRRGPLFSQRK